MMKIRLITLGVLATTLTSCYKDQGNYNYNFSEIEEINPRLHYLPQATRDINGVAVVEFPKTPESSSETPRYKLKIDQSKLELKGPHRTFWDISYRNEEETISERHEGDSTYFEIPPGKAPVYDVKVTIQYNDTTDLPPTAEGELPDWGNRLFAYDKMKITTKFFYENSLFVIHGDRIGNFELGNIQEEKDGVNIVYNAYNKLFETGDNPFAYATKLLPTVSSEELRGINALFVGFRDGRGITYNAYTMQELNSTQQTYPSLKDGIIIPKTFIHYPVGSSYYMIAEDGRFYIHIRKERPMFFIPGADLAPGDNPDHLTDYNVTAGLLMGYEAALWDQKGGRFLYANLLSGNSAGGGPSDYTKREQSTFTGPVIDARVNLSSLTPELTPKGKTPLYSYAQVQEDSKVRSGCMLFRNSSNEVYLYTIDRIRQFDRAKDPFFSVTPEKLDGLSFTDQTPIAFCSQFDLRTFFYAMDNKLFSYNTLTKQSTELYTAPAGYHITQLKFRQNAVTYNAQELHKYLDIALQKDKNGAIATIKLRNNGDVETSYTPRLYEGFGIIQDMAFIRKYLYKEL